MRSSAYETAEILVRELGRDGAIAYANKIANSGGPLSTEYAEAESILRAIFETQSINIADCLKSLYR